MKKIILLTFLFLFAYSLIYSDDESINQSDYDVDCVLEDFLVKLMNEPYKIQDLKANFPDFYDSIFINKDYNNKLLGEKWERLLLLIKNQIPKDAGWVKHNDSRDEFLKFYKKRMLYQDLKLDEIYSVKIIFGDCHDLNIDFIKKNNNYYLHSIYVSTLYLCQDELDALIYKPIEPILPLIYDISNNPNKILNLGSNYPNIFLEKYLDNEMNDSVYIKNLIFFINDFFNVSKINSEVTYEWHFYDFSHLTSEGERITIKLSKDKNRLRFEFINIDNKFYIKKIRFYFVNDNPLESP